MATGLNLNTGFAELANPYSLTRQDTAGISDVTQQAIQRMPSIEALVPQTAQPESKFWTNDITGEFYVNGLKFAQDDDAAVLQAEQLLDKPTVGRPQGEGWVPVDTATFGQIADKVRNPSMGRLFAKNFGIGVDQLQQLAGYGLQLAGAEELGGRIVAAQEEELRKASPYQKEFTGIDSGGAAVDWFVANLAQMGPSIIESIAVAGIGAAAGAGVPGALASLFAKQSFKKGVMEAAKRYTTAKAKGVAPTLADIKTLRNASAYAGAAATSFLSNYATGAADIYGEMRDQGVDPDDVAAKMTALMGAAPYAALESTGEFLLASRIFGGIKAPRALPAGATRTQRGVELLRRGAVGGAIGATAEGLTELGQEGIVMGLSGQNLTSDEAVKRFINSFAAGAAVGGALGGIANLKRGKGAGETGPTQSREISLLDSSGSSTEQKRLPAPPAPGTAVVPFTTPVTPMGAEYPAGPTPLLPAPGQVLQVRGRPDFVVDSTGTVRQGTPEDVVVGVTDNIPGAAPGMQGVLNIFGDEGVTAGELAARMQPTGQLGIEYTPTATQVPPGQLALQFAPPAPEGARFTAEPTGTMANRLQEIQDQLQRQREFDLAEQQRQQQEAALREQQMNLMERERQLQLAEEPLVPQPAPPMRPVPVRQPQQLPLFPPSELPRPSRGEALRRGVAGAGLPPLGREPTGLVRTELDEQGRPRVVATDVAPLTAQEARQAGQLPLFTQEGQPSVAALKAAGKRGPVPKPTPQKGAKQAPPTGRKPTPESKRKAQEEQRKKEEAKNELIRKGQLVQAGRKWPEFADPKTQPKWSELTDDQKEQWRLAFVEKRMSIAESERIAPPKKEKPSAVQKPSPKKVPTRGGAKAGAKVGKEVPSKGKAAGKGEDLKKGKPKQEAVTQATDDEFERVLNKYNALTVAQRNLVARELGVTREQMPDLLDERTADVDAAIDTVLAPPPAPAATIEEPFRQKTMAELEAEAAAQRPLRTERAAEPTVSETVDSAINTAETTVNADEFADAASLLMFHAYVDTDTNNRAANAKARKFIEETEFTAPQRQALNDALVDEIDIKGQIELARAGENKPVYKYLVDNNLLPRLNATTTGLTAENAAQLVRDGQLSLTNLTDKTAKDVIAANPDLVEQEANNLARGQGDSMQDNPGTKLAAAIREINLSQTQRNRPSIDAKIADIQAQWDALPDEYRDFVDETGTPLSEYFTDDELNATVVNRKLRITKQAYTDEQVAAFEADEMAEPDPELQRLEREERGRGEADWNAWNAKLRDGNFSRAEGGRITQPLPALRIRTIINKFLSKLAIKPRVYVYKDQADLKAKNPRLHQRAAESRPEGDFDSTPAVGFAFGNGEVIIFSDYIATEQQLNFVLAHETIGHFGMRGLIPAKQFDALMQKIYDDNPGIRGDIDARMAVDGMSLAEATEEYLADFAGILDTSIVARVWNAIKGVLNKLGIEFGDESARYFISQARKYVRNGGVGVPFEISTVINRLHEIEYGLTPTGGGRFAAVGDLYRDVRLADLARDKIGGLPMSFEEAINWFKGQGVNSVSSYDKFKAKFLSLANFRARENPGAQAMENLIDEMRNISMSIKVEMNEKLREVLNKAAFGKYWGITDEQLDRLNRATYAAQRLAVNKFDRAKERTREPLYKFVDGILEPNQDEIDRLKDAGRITFEQMRDGFSYEVTALEGGKEVTKTERFEGVPGLTEDSIEWRGYQQLRDAMDDVELRLLRARYMSGIVEQDIAFNEIEELMSNNELTNTDRTFLRKALAKYKDLYTEGLELDENGYPVLNADAMTKGNDFLVELNTAILGERTDRTDALVKKYFTGKAADDFGAQLNDFKSRLRLPKENEFFIQNRVKQLVLADMANTDADLFTRRSIATGYTPILREGTHQLRVEAIDPRTDKQVQLKQSSRDQLIYSQYSSPKQAQEAADAVNEVFGDNLYEVEAYDPNSGEYVIEKVKLRAVGEVALDSIAAPPELNLNEFVRGLRQFDIAVTPRKMEEVVTALTRQNNAARNRLERAFVAGANQEATVAISRHIESRASTIAKTLLRPRLAELMNLNLAKTRRIWNGDIELLQRLKENAEQVEADPNATDEQKALARREYQRYQFMYDTTNPKGGVKRGMQYYNEASRTAAFLDGNRNVDESDFGSGPLVSFIRAATSLIQLGGSIATGVLNVIGAYTNGIPYLSTYNAKNGFGGGFGLGKSVAQFHIALKDVGGIGMNPFSEDSRAANRAEFYDRVANDPQLQQRYNLKEHEARFIAREIREGTMIPAQSNALVGTSRGRATKGWQQKFIDGWMMPFNLTEQASRRALGLAAYRLEYQRQKGAGKSDIEAESAARKFAVGTLQLTLGEYSVLNRPSAWRSGIQSFIYMYKVFPTTSIQLLANLPRSGQIGMLAGLFLLSGLTGLPFAEDLEDIIDTIAQKLGFRQGSIRFEIAKRIDEIMPGLSPYILTGVANSLSVGNIGIRTSLGNVFPGTGLFLSGANTSRELMDIAGPAASAITGTVKTAYDIARLPFSDQVTLTDVARESPVTIARAFGDAYAYAQTGAIVDRRGYMVSDDMTVGTIAARMLGFYPTAAADQYSMIRIAKRMTDYQRDTSAGFRTAWISAMQTGDRDRARSIEEAVREWNDGARGTALEIRNFRANAQRALREAQRPAGERTLRSAPRAAREDIERLSNLLSN